MRTTIRSKVDKLTFVHPCSFRLQATKVFVPYSNFSRSINNLTFWESLDANVPITRMHSSRMRTARFNGHFGGRGRILGSLPLGLGRGSVHPPGQTPPGRHAPLPISFWDISPPPWTEFLTHACENITFPQLLLRPVKIFFNMLLEFFFMFVGSHIIYQRYTFDNTWKTISRGLPGL